MFMLIVCVVLHLTAKQVQAEEIQCPSECTCPNNRVAICKDLKIDGIIIGRENKFEASLEKLDFSGNILSSLNDDMFSTWKVLNLQCFNLSGNNIVNITKYAFSGFSQLEDLDLSTNNISSIDSATFHITPNLTVLRLANNRLTEIDLATFIELHRLRHLDLSDNCLYTIHPATFLKNDNLVRLSLANNRLTAVQPEIFQNQSNLSYLNLSGNKSMNELSSLDDINLQYFNLSGNNIQNITNHSFTGFLHLKYLDLSRNNISLIDLSAFNLTVNITFLNLGSNRLSEIHPSTFGSLYHLRRLDLSGNSIFSFKPKTFYKNFNLEQLYLANNRLTEVNPQTFQNQNNLLHLDLSGNRMTKIERAIFYSTAKLESLFLSKNGIVEINDEAFHRLEKLEKLDLSSNNITNISLPVFRDMLPQMETNMPERTCFSKITYLNLSNNKIHTFNLIEFLLSNVPITSSLSINFCELKHLDLSGNCLSVSDDKSVNVLTYSRTSINISDNPWSCQCPPTPTTRAIYNENQTSHCAAPAHIGKKGCYVFKDKCYSAIFLSVPEETTQTDGDLKKEGSENLKLMRVNIFIFGIYATSVFVAVVVVLVITHFVGKPEPDEFWWEDKLAKRNYK